MSVPFDILFSPSGELIGVNGGIVALTLRDTTRAASVSPLTNQTKYDLAGQMILICIYAKTGAIATQTVAPPSVNDPFKFAKDGINTGL